MRGTRHLLGFLVAFVLTGSSASDKKTVEEDVTVSVSKGRGLSVSKPK